MSAPNSRNQKALSAGTTIGSHEIVVADRRRLTAFHLMLKKGSDFAMLAKHGARGDLPWPDGKIAIEIMSRKKDERFRNLARRLASSSTGWRRLSQVSQQPHEFYLLSVLAHRLVPY